MRDSNRTIKAILFLSALLLSASAQPQTITGNVVGVSDGDTITVLDAVKHQHKPPNFVTTVTTRRIAVVTA